MDGRKIVVVEANEVPLRVVEDQAASGRVPFLAGLLAAGRLIETRVEETLQRELYPSQTWASMNTGVAFDQHRVYWYGDSKPEAYPLYWQRAAAAGRSVGLVNTLHSSPLSGQCSAGDYRFVVPDSFATDDRTIPARLGRFQRANRCLTAANGRKTELRPSLSPIAGLLSSLPGLGLRATTTVEVARLVAGVAAGRVPRERLRAGQFLLQRDLFLSLLRSQRPDVAVLFTNHVAAAMHRYWYALYPNDFTEEHYPPDWVDRYRAEIPQALVLLDRFLADLHRFCLEDDRTLLVVSSMGQGPSLQLSSEAGTEAVVADPRRFLDAIKVDPRVVVKGSMVPQLTLDCGDQELAAATASRLADAEVGEVFWDVDGAEAVVTLTYRVEVLEGGMVRLSGARRLPASIGVQVHEIDDHSSGRHIELGILGVANSPTFKPPTSGVVDYLEYAPALLRHLGVAPAAHHRPPGFEL